MSADISPLRSIETLAPFRRSPESQAGIAGIVTSLRTVGAAQNAESSVLAIIDTKTMTLVASATVHGSFVRKEA